MTAHLRDMPATPTLAVSLPSRPAVTEAALRMPRVVIVGAGFAGLAAATALKHAAVQVTIIDRRNYHLFQPLLYQVATAALSPADIAQPKRNIFRRQRNATVLLGRVTGIDTAAREVSIGERRVAYDQTRVRCGRHQICVPDRHGQCGGRGLALAGRRAGSCGQNGHQSAGEAGLSDHVQRLSKPDANSISPDPAASLTLKTFPTAP